VSGPGCWGWFQAVVLLDLVSYLAAAAIGMSVTIPAIDQPDCMTARVSDQLRQGLRHIAGTRMPPNASMRDATEPHRLCYRFVCAIRSVRMLDRHAGMT
jgi:hypothetical protein